MACLQQVGGERGCRSDEAGINNAACLRCKQDLQEMQHAALAPRQCTGSLVAMYRVVACKGPAAAMGTNPERLACAYACLLAFLADLAAQFRRHARAASRELLSAHVTGGKRLAVSRCFIACAQAARYSRAHRARDRVLSSRGARNAHVFMN